MKLLKVFFSVSLLIFALSLTGCQGSNGDKGGGGTSSSGSGSSGSGSGSSGSGSGSSGSGSVSSGSGSVSSGSGSVSSGGGLPPVVDTNTTNVTITLNQSSAVLSKNSQSFNIDVKAFDTQNRPYSTGNVEIVYPNDVKTGRDIGSFNQFVSPLKNGVATFVYTAPTNLDANKSNIVFGFFHDSNPANVLTYTMKIVPDVNQTVNTTYRITTGVTNDLTMLPEDVKSVNYAVVDRDGVTVPNDRITNISVTTLNPNVGTLQEGATNANTISFTKNNISLNVISKTLSGIVPLKVDAIFKDANGVSKSLSKQFNIVVISGPPSAMSLNYSSTEPNDGSTTSFTENWILKVTDKYDNVVNTAPSVSMGLIAGYATDSSNAGVGGSANNYLYFKNGGTLSSTNNSFTGVGFENVNPATETLVTFGDGFTYPASGKWDINTVSPTVLTLNDTYEGNNTSNLGYAVGFNHRQDPNGGEAIATVKPKDNNFLLNSNGIMTIQVTYDYYLTGKDVVLWVNLIGEDLPNGKITRVGEAKKITLRALGLQDDSISTSPKATNVNYTFSLKINSTEEYYRDGNFAYKYKLSDNLQLNSITTSNGTLNGPAFITFNVTDISPDGQAGSISISDAAVTHEF